MEELLILSKEHPTEILRMTGDGLRTSLRSLPLASSVNMTSYGGEGESDCYRNAEISVLKFFVLQIFGR